MNGSALNLIPLLFGDMHGAEAVNRLLAEREHLH